MTLAFDARTVSLSAATINTFSHTVADSGNMGLLVFLQMATATSRTATVTYNGVSMTQEVSAENAIASGFIKTVCFSLIDPSKGANDVVVTWNGAIAKGITVAASYSGANQTDIVTASNSNQTNSGNYANVTVTTVNKKSFVVGGYTFEGGDGDPATPGGSVNERWDTATGPLAVGDISSAGGDKLKIIAGATTVDFTISATDDWVMVGVELVAEPAIVRGLAIFY